MRLTPAPALFCEKHLGHVRNECLECLVEGWRLKYIGLENNKEPELRRNLRNEARIRDLETRLERYEPSKKRKK